MHYCPLPLFSLKLCLTQICLCNTLSSSCHFSPPIHWIRFQMKSRFWSMNFINLFPMHSTHIKFSVQLSYVGFWFLPFGCSGGWEIPTGGLGLEGCAEQVLELKGIRHWLDASGIFQHITSSEPSINSNNAGLAGTAKDWWKDWHWGHSRVNKHMDLPNVSLETENGFDSIDTVWYQGTI